MSSPPATLTPERLRAIVEAAWERRAELAPGQDPELEAAVAAALDALDAGALRVAERTDAGAWHTHAWLKMAILLSFRLKPERRIEGAPDGSAWWDKVPSKFADWGEADFRAHGFRAVPGALVRHSAYIAPGAVLMPSFVNVGARVGEGTMIDTWATVGSCAQVGRNCHISGGAGIGGVLEPLQANPVIIEDEVFIGARSEVAEGVVVRQGAVLSMGVYLGASTRIVDRATGEVLYGEVPPYAVVVPGAMASPSSPEGAPQLYCAVIVKRVDEKTRARTSLNELLRDG